jgi:hypothetical protein
MATKYVPPQRRTDASPWAKPANLVTAVEEPKSTRYIPPNKRELVKANSDSVDISEKNFPSLGQSKTQKTPAKSSSIEKTSLSDMIKEKIKRDSELNNQETDCENMSYEQLAKDGWCVIHIPSKTYLTGPLEPI